MATTLQKLLGGLLAWTALGASPMPNPRRVTSADLGGPDRYLTHVDTDKPIYREGETAYVRGVLLHALRSTPCREPATASVEVRGPRGEIVASGSATTQDSVWAFAWTIPAGTAGGEYTVRASYPWHGHTPGERRIEVRSFRTPRLKTQIVFLREGYGPGDRVTATLEVERAEGGAPAGATVTGTARVDGQEVARVQGRIDSRGRWTIEFDLPESIARGDGALAFAIEDGGVVETAAKTLPIVVRTVELELFPEGGELVAGLPSRVYFQARGSTGKPADLAGVVEDDRGVEVARFRSEHEGRGRFGLTPRPGRRYTLRVTEPAGVGQTWALPLAQREGAVLVAGADVFAPGQPVVLDVASTTGPVTVTLSKRERELASVPVTEGRATVRLDPEDADGALVATVWSRRGEPLAERLVFRRPSKRLEVELRADKRRYVPGDTVRLTVRATAGGRPASAVIGLSVTDEATLELVERREQAPSLPAMALLEPEVRELADAHVYLDPQSSKAGLATDLLLGTQGWRRFALVRRDELVAAHGDAGRRVLAERVAVERHVAVAELDVVRKRSARFGPRAAAVVEDQARAAPGEAPMAPAAAAPPFARAPQAPPPVAPPPMAKDERVDDDIQGGLRAGAPVPRGRAVAKRPAEAAAGGLVAIRVYAHAARPGRRPGERVDFTETPYWAAGLRTDAATGEATVRFVLPDAVTTFVASAGGFSDHGHLGAARLDLEAVQPLYVEAKVPLEVTSGDRVRLPLALVNGTEEPLTGVKVGLEPVAGVELGAVPPLSIPAGARARALVDLRVASARAPVTLEFAARAEGLEERVSRTLVVRPLGYPGQIHHAGLVSPEAPARHRVKVPAQIVPGTLTARVSVQPSPLATLTEALAQLIREPSGCFEQTSSTTYPLTMAQQYFTSHGGVDPALVRDAHEKLERGYQRLVGFECSEKGYEWFGENPGHEALTAYGLLHFTDMAQVRSVDRDMLARTRSWLLAQRDGQGGFHRKRRALHTWVEDRDASNGYILWALMESGGAAGLEREVASFESAAARSANAYVTALGANVALLAGHRSAARPLLERLARQQGAEGAVAGGTGSIVGSGGEALAVEVTALAALAWLREPSFSASTDRALRYLAEISKGGRYGSTQSTVLALRAIVAFDRARARASTPGSLRLFVDDREVGPTIAFDEDARATLTFPDLAASLSPGRAHALELRMKGGRPMPYTVALEYTAAVPESARETAVGLEVRLAAAEVAEGELVEATARITNLRAEALPTVVAIVGLPGGLEPRHDQLKELVKAGRVHAYEVRGRDVVLYWRDLGPQAAVAVPLSLVAAVPGTYVGPASRAYLYYTDEHKRWIEPLRVTIAPR